MLLAFSLIVASTAVILVRNPVFSSVFLIISFCLGSVYILYSGILEYIALIYIIVYVGAVAVLFLFVIMMLEVRLLEERYSGLSFLPFVGFLFGFLMLQFFFVGPESHNGSSFILFSDVITSSMWYSSEYNNMLNLSTVFFSVYGYVLIMCSGVLLVGMIGALLIALIKRENLPSQYGYVQAQRKNVINLYKLDVTS